MRWTVLLFTLFLAACSGNQLDKSKTFTEGSDKAIVALAVISDGSGPSSPLLVWSGFDADSMLMIDKRVKVNKRTDSDAGDVLVTMLRGQRDYGGKNYYVFEVDPGGYFLEYVWASGTSGLIKRRITTIYTTNSPSFIAEAGKVYYIGDFQYTAVGGQNTLRPVADDIESAQAVVRSDYPNVTAPVLHLPPRSVKLNCRGQRKNAFGSDTDFCGPGETDVIYEE